MMISNYNTGIPNGVTVHGIPLNDIQNSNGNVFWVDFNHYLAADSNKGTFVRPLKTLKAAVSKCRPNQGDKIFVAAGHVEELDTTNKVEVNVAGIQIIGLGIKNNRPLFRLSTGFSAFKIIAENVYLGNVHILGTHLIDDTGDLGTLLKVSNRNVYIENVFFENLDHTHGALNFLEIPAASEEDYISNGATIAFCEFNQPSTFSDVIPTMLAGIYVGSSINNLHIHACSITGKFDKACIYNLYVPFGGLSENLIIDGSNYFLNELIGVSYKAIVFFSGLNGFISTDTVAVTLNSDGEDIELGGRLGRGINGDFEYIVRQVEYTTLGASAVLLTNPIEGSYKLENVTYETDGVGMGALNGNIELSKFGEISPRGNSLLSSIPQLGIFTPNQTIEMNNPSATVTNFGTIITGASLYLFATTAPAVTGYMKVTIALRKMTDATYYISHNLL